MGPRDQSSVLRVAQRLSILLWFLSFVFRRQSKGTAFLKRELVCLGGGAVSWWWWWCISVVMPLNELPLGKDLRLNRRSHAGSMVSGNQSID